MDRQRVVHFAKTRTARVLSPVYSSRQSPSHSTATSDPSHAPLASIDSDLVVITKRRDETNTAPDLWDQIRKSVPMSTSGLFDPSNFFNEQNEYIPARTYVKLRSTQNEDALVDSPGFDDNNVDEQNTSMGIIKGHNLASSTVKNPHLAFSALTSPTHIANTAVKGDIKSKKDSHCIHKEFKGTETCTSPDTKYIINRHAIKNREQIVPSKNSTQTETKSRTVFPSPPVPSVQEPNSISKNDSLKSLNRVQTLPGARQNHASPSDSSSSCKKQFGINAPLNLKRMKDVQNSKCFHHVTSEHHQSNHETKGFHISKEEGHSSDLLPEMLQPFKCIEKEEFPLPEMGSLSPSAYTSNIRLTAERIYSNRDNTSRINANDCKEHSSYSLVSTSKTSSNPTVPGSKSNTDYGSSQNASEFQTRSQNDSFSQSLKHGSYNTDSPKVKHGRFKDENNVRNFLKENLGCNFMPESSFSCKRSSLKLATQGYSSISDLAGSFETKTQVKPNSEYQSYANANVGSYKGVSSHILENTCSDGQGSIKGRSGLLKSKENYNALREDDTLDLNKFHEYDYETNEIKRLSFKLATSNAADVLFHDKDLRKSKASNIRDETPLSRNKREITTGVGQGSGHIPVNTNTKSPVKYFGDSRPNSYQRNFIAQYNDEETLRKLKRRSFMLATHSTSDLTLLDEFMQYEHDLEFRDQEQFSEQSVSNCSFHTPDSRIARFEDKSFNSSHHNSSFGSFHSCRSLDIPKHQQLKSLPLASRKTLPQHDKAKTLSSPSYGHRAFRRSVDSDSSFSGDSSVYLTASDNSFITADGSSNNSPCRSQVKQKSFKPQLFSHWRMSPGSLNQKNVQNKNESYSGSHKASTLPTRSQVASKQRSAGNVFQRYGCEFHEGLSVPTQNKRRTNNYRRVVDMSRVCTSPEYVHRKQRDDRKRRSQSVPSTQRARPILSGPSTKHAVLVHTQKHTETKIPTHNWSSSSRITESHISGLETSVFPDSSWEVVPRIPPSLGRPRRKLYAGFDSQPLPMDSFLSDSSSVYSTQSCSSWSTSRSATTESTSKNPEKPSKARSASSISSSAITPTIQVSQNEVFDFFTFTGKRSSVCDNKHNIYLSRENSCVDDCFKDRFFDKAYSKESLESILSDGTTVNMDHNLSPKSSLDYMKAQMASSSSITDFHEKDSESRVGKHMDTKHHLDKLNNLHRVQFGSSLENVNSQRIPSGNEIDKNQLKSLKALSSASPQKSTFLSKRKYFSCKDILDLVMASERNYQHSRGRSRSLERQAQKMCEVILCIGAE